MTENCTNVGHIQFNIRLPFLSACVSFSACNCRCLFRYICMNDHRSVFFYDEMHIRTDTPPVCLKVNFNNNQMKLKTTNFSNIIYQYQNMNISFQALRPCTYFNNERHSIHLLVGFFSSLCFFLMVGKKCKILRKMHLVNPGYIEQLNSRIGIYLFKTRPFGRNVARST